jgi:hypothetical protein
LKFFATLILFFSMFLSSSTVYSSPEKRLIINAQDISQIQGKDFLSSSGISKSSLDAKSRRGFEDQIRNLERVVSLANRSKSVSVNVDAFSLMLEGAKDHAKRGNVNRIVVELFDGEEVSIEIDPNTRVIQSGTLVGFTGRMVSANNKKLPVDTVRIHMRTYGTVTIDPIVFEDRFYAIKPIVDLPLHAKGSIPHVIYEYDPKKIADLNADISKMYSGDMIPVPDNSVYPNDQSRNVSKKDRGLRLAPTKAATEGDE